jgi:hypothetical protein
MFDVAYYRRTQATDLDRAADAFGHYVQEGWKRGLDPAPWFSTAHYLDDHPDVAHAGLCPFEHYANRGRYERRRVRPSAASAVADSNGSPQTVRGASTVPGPLTNGQTSRRTDPDRLARDLVDEPFYLSRYPDVAAAGMRASEHFMTFGWHEGRDPNPWFSCGAYLVANPDVRREHLNPLLHWIASGRRDNRPGSQTVAHQWIHALSQRDLVSVAANRVRGDPPAAHGVDEALCELKATAIHDGGVIVISVGNDDYLVSTGGIEACVRYEAAELSAAGINYLYLHPLLALPTLNDSRGTAVRPILNGEPMPAISTGDLAALVRGLLSLGARPAERMVVHGLLGHNPAALRAQAQFMNLEIDYWSMTTSPPVRATPSCGTTWHSAVLLRSRAGHAGSACTANCGQAMFANSAISSGALT